jgi:hypothetical protein
MKRFLNIVGIVLGVSLTLVVAAYGLANAKEGGKMMGIVAAERTASVEVMDQPGAEGSIVVASVKVPRASWLAVHLDDNGMPGKRIGLKAIPAGTSKDVTVELDKNAKLTDKVIVAVHADYGTIGTFEFAMDRFESSADKPYFVGGMELAMEASVAKKPFGVVAAPGTASIKVSDQPGVTSTLVVDEAIAPTGAFVVVHADDNGKPGARLGVTPIPAGTSTKVAVTLDPSVPLTDKVLVAVHADRGTAGVFEFDMMDKYNSPDQPFFVDGQEVATAAAVK